MRHLLRVALRPDNLRNGDKGVYTSTDAHVAHVALVASDATYSSVVAIAPCPRRAYANTGTAIYTTADPADPNTAYARVSFPLGVAAAADAGAVWHNVLP